jgi:hypothetical protein
MSLNDITAERGPRTLTINSESGDVLVPVTPDASAEVCRNPRTVKRWIKDPKMKFPATIRLNNRLYVSRREFEAWKRNLFESALGGKVA